MLKLLKRFWPKKPKQQPTKDKGPEVYYVLRYLEPKGTGEGEISHAFSTNGKVDKQWVKNNPQLFTKPGFYTVMKATGLTHTVN